MAANLNLRTGAITHVRRMMARRKPQTPMVTVPAAIGSKADITL